MLCPEVGRAGVGGEVRRCLSRGTAVTGGWCRGAESTGEDGQSGNSKLPLKPTTSIQFRPELLCLGVGTADIRQFCKLKERRILLHKQW